MEIKHGLNMSSVRRQLRKRSRAKKYRRSLTSPVRGLSPPAFGRPPDDDARIKFLPMHGSCCPRRYDEPMLQRLSLI